MPQPSDISYRAVALSASVELVWPTLAETSADVCARLMDVTPSAGSLAITLPPATQVSTGQDALIRNLGAQTFTIKDNDGGVIATIASGVAKYFYLTSNSTNAGTWRVVTFGTGTSSADASALAGAGLTTYPDGLLNLYHPVTGTSGSTWTVSSDDRAKEIRLTGGNTVVDLPTAGGVDAPNGFFFFLKNAGTGTVTITPSGIDTIDGVVTVDLAPEESCIVLTNGNATWDTVGLGRSVNFAFTQLTKNVAGSSNVTLTSAECQNKIIQFTGALTGNINVYVTNTVSVYYVYNNTTGASNFTLTVKTVAGTGVETLSGVNTILVCDGTDVYAAQDVDATSGIFTRVLVTGRGLESGPVYTFTADQDTGLYSPGANLLAVTAGGTDAMRWNTAALAVNAIDVFPSAAGSPVYLLAYGDDTNIPFQIRAKGTGYLGLGQATATDVRLLADQPIADSSGNEFLKFTKAATAVNEFTIANAAAGSSPSISATGGDTDINLKLIPKGAGGVDLAAFYMQMAEMTIPAAPAANGVRVYAVDNGAGKTQLMAIFNSGAAQQLAIQP